MSHILVILVFTLSFNILLEFLMIYLVRVIYSSGIFNDEYYGLVFQDFYLYLSRLVAKLAMLAFLDFLHLCA